MACVFLGEGLKSIVAHSLRRWYTVRLSVMACMEGEGEGKNCLRVGLNPGQ